MAWVRIDDNAPHHRKMLKAGPAACWLWVCGIAYCQRMSSDGFIPIEALPLLGVGAWRKPASCLVDACLWHQDDGGYRVHDYLDYQFSAIEADERKAKHSQERAEAGRLGGLRSGEARRAKQHEANHEAKQGSKTQANEAPSHPIPSQDRTKETDPTTSSPSVPAVASSALIVSPKEFARLHEKNAFVGSRLRVPNVLHDELWHKLGGERACGRLMDWYADLNRTAEESGEAIPDIFDWLRPRFKVWAEQFAAPVPGTTVDLDAFRPKGA